MTRLPTRVVGDAYTNPVSWEILTELVDIQTRMAGHEGEQKGMNILAEAFREHGLREVEIDQFDIPAWYRGDCTLGLPERDQEYGSPHQIIALPRTPAETVEAELVDAGYGTSEELEEVNVEGKIVIALSGTPEGYEQWSHRRDKYEKAIELGAEGFLLRSHAEGCLPPTGDIGDEEGPGAIPAAGISRELGSRLVRYCEDDRLVGKLAIDCENTTETSGNVSARLGPETDRKILVTAHHDAHDIAEGAKDNGFGCALVVEIARLLSQIEDELETEVRFVTFGAEELGLFGSEHLVETTSLDTIEAVLNVDGVGDSRDLAVYTHGFDAFAEVFEDVSETLGIPIELRDDVNTHSDHWSFVKEGVPGAVANSTSGSQDRGWAHTHADTLDKLDKRDLRDIAVALATGVLGLAEREQSPEHVDPRTISQRAEKEIYEIS